MRAVLRAAVLALAFVAGGAEAAPARAKPAAATACAAYGAGFRAVPGTDTCLRTGGRVRMEAGTAARRTRAAPATGTMAKGTLTLDARTQTEAGPLRVFVRTGVARGTGAWQRP